MAKIKYKNNGGWIELSASDINAASNNIIVNDNVNPVNSTKVTNETKLYIDNTPAQDDQGTILRIQTKDIDFPLSYENGGTNASSLSQAKDNLGISDTKIIDLIYPIGSIYITVNDTNPNLAFPGTAWEKIKGRFLVSAEDNEAAEYEQLNLTLGDTGGETNHLLKIAEMGVPSHNHGRGTYYMPSHNHRLPNSAMVYDSGGTAFATGSGTKMRTNTDVSKVTDARGGTGTYIGGTSANSGGSTTYIGGTSADNTEKNATSAHNNLPPYLVVNMWKRIPATNN